MLLVYMEEEFMKMVPDFLAFSKQPGENECLSSVAAWSTRKAAATTSNHTTFWTKSEKAHLGPHRCHG